MASKSFDREGLGERRMKQGNGDTISSEVAENGTFSAVLKNMQVGTLLNH